MSKLRRFALVVVVVSAMFLAGIYVGYGETLATENDREFTLARVNDITILHPSHVFVYPARDNSLMMICNDTFFDFMILVHAIGPISGTTNALFLSDDGMYYSGHLAHLSPIIWFNTWGVYNFDEDIDVHTMDILKLENGLRVSEWIYSATARGYDGGPGVRYYVESRAFIFNEHLYNIAVLSPRSLVEQNTDIFDTVLGSISLYSNGIIELGFFPHVDTSMSTTAETMWESRHRQSPQRFITEGPLHDLVIGIHRNSSVEKFSDALVIEILVQEDTPTDNVRLFFYKAFAIVDEINSAFTPAYLEYSMGVDVIMVNLTADHWFSATTFFSISFWPGRPAVAFNRITFMDDYQISEFNSCDEYIMAIHAAMQEVLDAVNNATRGSIGSRFDTSWVR